MSHVAALTAGPQDGTVFGDGTFKVVIKAKMRSIWMDSNPTGLVSLKEEIRTQTPTEGHRGKIASSCPGGRPWEGQRCPHKDLGLQVSSTGTYTHLCLYCVVLMSPTRLVLIYYSPPVTH